MASAGSSTSNRHLWYQYIPNPGTTPWPAWVDSGIHLSINCKPGLLAGRVWFLAWDGVSGTGNLKYADFNGTSFGAPVTLSYTDYADIPIAIAPVTATSAYLHTQMSGPPLAGLNFGYIDYASLSGTTVNTLRWPGRIYGPNQYARVFDATRDANGEDHVFFTDHDEKRTMFLKAISSSGTMSWSEVKPVIPLDVTDDTSKFLLGGAN